MSSGRRRLRATRAAKEPSPEDDLLSSSEDDSIKSDNPHDLIDDENDESSSQSGGGLLDVLAQVATEKLNEEPSSQYKNATGKITQRSIRSRDVLTLEQISCLTDKALVNLFSEMTANEMTRNYTFTCYLMPEKCKKTFTSFGNENKARMQVRTHLFNHVCDLIDDANDPGKTQRVKFTSEPVVARKRRVAAEYAHSKKKPGKSEEEHTPAQSPKGPVKSSSKKSGGRMTKLKDLTIRKNPSGSGFRAVRVNPRFAKPAYLTIDDVKKQKASILKNIKKVKTDLGEGRTIIHDNAEQHGHNIKNASWSKFTLEEERTSSGTSKKKYKLDKDFQNPDSKKSGSSTDANDTDSIIRTNEQFIIDLMNRSQPHHDHCYTTIFGKKKGIERLHFDIDSESDDDSDKSDDIPIRFLSGNQRAMLGNTNMTLTDTDKVTMQMKGGLLMKGDNTTLAVLELSKIPLSSDGFPVVSAEEVVGSTVDQQIIEVASNRPYPPMPKDPLARQGKMLVPEEQTSEEEEDLDRKTGKKRKLVEGSTEWERKTALRCIRELKSKGRNDRAILKCKICQNKTFTASATLMYHYRSHAGIKPFICLVCNTTFTRQHSLNYHMLIHNNMSRFKCNECSREFRHPSHFKEHLRRHTGETPFECSDCPLKFKTRNTYKRHLKTRHGKLLTAQGIYLMPNEEFEKVRTKRYKCRGYTPIEDMEARKAGQSKVPSHIERTEEDSLVDVESVENAANSSANTPGFVKL